MIRTQVSYPNTAKKRPK